jgi:3'(2'),5'-bisphosphate nucleotidase
MMVSKKQLDTLCQIAREAGDEIMAIYRDGGQAWRSWQKNDASPLTEADLRADRVIRAGLERHFPGVFILSEESVSEGTKIDGEFFLVDPLDGTKEFLKRNDEFTVNIALIVEGIPVMGVVFAPALGEMFYAAQGEGAWKQDAQGLHAISTSLHDGVRPLRVMGSRSHGADKLNAWLDNLTQVHTFTAAGSSLKFCRIAEGLADIYPRFGPTSQWDTAAAQALLEEAGGKVVDMQGDRLHYGLDRPILNPEFMAVGALNVSEFIG